MTRYRLNFQTWNILESKMKTRVRSQKVLANIFMLTFLVYGLLVLFWFL